MPSRSTARATADLWSACAGHLDALEPPNPDEPPDAVHAAIRAALHGEWGPYDALLDRRGAAHAARGLGIDTLDLPGRVLATLGAPLVRALGDDPDRLIAALEALAAFAGRRSSALSVAYDAACRAALRLAERRLAIAVDHGTDGVITTDEAGLVDRVSKTAQLLVGWTSDDARGRPLDDVVRLVEGDTGSPIASRIRDVLRDGVPRHLDDAALVDRDGGRHPIADHLAPVRDDLGAIRGAVVVIRDLGPARAADRALADAQRRLRSLAERIEAFREDERTRVARELHDVLGQDLTAIRMDLQWLLRRRTAPDDDVGLRLQAMTSLVDALIGTVHRIATDLRPGILDDLGLPDAIEWQAAEFERRSGIAVEVEASPDAAGLDRAQSTALFRMFQEILTNVARHAGATRVEGRLAVDGDEVTLDVRDDGCGIRPDAILDPASLGLLGMRERAALHNGTVRIERARRGGTVVAIRMPRTEEVPP